MENNRNNTNWRYKCNVENRFKIVKDTLIGDYAWNSSSTNNWVNASLNTYLNGNYFNSLSATAQNMIGTAKYYLGGCNSAYITTDVMWQYERKKANDTSEYYYGSNPKIQSVANKKIALMYASDYGYAASKDCVKTLSTYDDSALCKTTNNWLDKSQHEWLLNQYSGSAIYVFRINSTSHLSVDNHVSVGTDNARPTLYLSSLVELADGKGTSDEPYTLSLN